MAAWAWGSGLARQAFPVEALAPGDGVVVGGCASPPEEAVTVAVPERLSATRRLRAIPRWVRVSRSTCPRLVDQSTTVPSATSVPAGSVTIAISSETPPWEAMRSGLATSVSVEPEGAVRYAPPQLSSEDGDPRGRRLSRSWRHRDPARG